MQSMREGFTHAAAEAEIARRLKAGECALLVGAKPRNLPQWMQRHPQIELWDSEGPEVDRRSVPKGARIVLFLKWIAHHNHQRIRQEAQQDGDRFVWPELLETGELRRMLAPLFEERERDEPVQLSPVPPASRATPIGAIDCDCGQPIWAGTVRDFVTVHIGLDDGVYGWKTREAQRLHRLAGQHRLVATLHYLENLMSELAIRPPARDEAQLQRENAERAAAAVKLAEPTVADLCDPAYTPPAKPAPPPVPPAKPAPPLDDLQAGEQRVNAEIGALLGYLADARAVLSLAEETLQQIADENARLREQRAALRARVLRVIDEL